MSETLDYKCSACGGRLEFDAATQKLKCPFCDSVYELSDFEQRDETTAEQAAQAAADAQDEINVDWDTTGIEKWDDSEAGGLTVYVCQSCGGEIVADATTAATSCPFCDNPVTVPKKFGGDLKPDYIIPFRLDKEAAKAGFRSHLSGKRLLPKVFRTENHIDEIKGIYVPFWLFDSQVIGMVDYRAKKERKRTQGDYEITETDHYEVRRTGNLRFERVPVNGSGKMADSLMESIEPFDFSQAVEFRSAYLAGYLADRYDVSLEASLPRANERIKHSTEDEFAKAVQGYTAVEPVRSILSFSKPKVSYALYPVWILNTTWNGNKYTFAMNGQTGKFVGDLPVDKATERKWFWGLGLGITAAFYALIAVIIPLLS